tara:strand:- start:250 stop:516 length:267 start_codon:yes stop_codon:yes gene_type:complete
MKITKRQLRRIIREEKVRLLREAGSPADRGFEAARVDDKTAAALQMLQTLNVNLQNIHVNTSGEMYDDLNEQIALLINAIRKLGGVAS